MRSKGKQVAFLAALLALAVFAWLRASTAHKDVPQAGRSIEQELKEMEREIHVPASTVHFDKFDEINFHRTAGESVNIEEYPYPDRFISIFGDGRIRFKDKKQKDWAEGNISESKVAEFLSRINQINFTYIAENIKPSGCIDLPERHIEIILNGFSYKTIDDGCAVAKGLRDFANLIDGTAANLFEENYKKLALAGDLHSQWMLVFKNAPTDSPHLSTNFEEALYWIGLALKTCKDRACEKWRVEMLADKNRKTRMHVAPAQIAAVEKRIAEWTPPLSIQDNKK